MDDTTKKRLPYASPLLSSAQLSRTQKFEKTTPLRAVFLEYSPTTEKHSAARPFRHCRVVVTHEGDHQVGEPLNEASSGFVYDRIGAKYRDGKKDKELGVVMDQELYVGLKAGHWSVYCGFTRYAPDDIHQWVNKQVQFDICNGVKYSFLMYNCQHFARLVVSIISRDSEVGYKQNPGAKAGPLAVEAFGSRILTTEDADIFFGEEKAYMSISEAYGHYKCN